MTTRVVGYIDGLNVYHGLRSKGWRDALWLDYRQLLEQRLLPTQTLLEVYYFTAHRRSPPDSYARQEIYFDALDERGGIIRVEGEYEKQRAPCLKCGGMAEIPRERQTDVNFASQLVSDALTDRFDTAFLLTGDADYLHPISLVRATGKRVGLLSIPARRSPRLAAAVDFELSLTRSNFIQSRLPNPLPRAKGTPIACPNAWMTLSEKLERLPAGRRDQIAVIKRQGVSLGLLHRIVDELSEEVNQLLRN